jgi:hypothetical protein
MLEQMGPAQVKILAKLAFGKAAVLNAVTCDGVAFTFRLAPGLSAIRTKLPISGRPPQLLFDD